MANFSLRLSVIDRTKPQAAGQKSPARDPIFLAGLGHFGQSPTKR